MVDDTATRRIRFSLVSAVHDVSRYLPDFIASIEAQDLGLDAVEVVAVDDGSNDDSLEVLRAWQARRPDLVRVLTKPNGGQGSARNLGLDHAVGEWVSFPDPDDVLAPDYLRRVAGAIDAEPGLALVATNRMILVDETGEVVDQHPLRRMFAHRDQVKDLDRFPELFHGSAPAAFFRRDRVEEHGLRFDERIQPNFEDGHFCQRYLLRSPVRLVAFLRSAVYRYRKRLDQTSTLQTGSLKPSRYTAVPRHGYLELLREGAAMSPGNRAPEWLQNMIIYELSYYISPEESGWTSATACHGAVADEFVGLLREIRTELDDVVIAGFSARRLRSQWRQLLLHGFADTPWFTPYAVLHRYDESRRQVLLSYRWTGPEPAWEVELRGVPVDPVATKVRDFVYFDRPLLHERLIWVSARGTLRLRLDGRPVDLLTNWAERQTTSLRPAALRNRLAVTAARSLATAATAATPATSSTAAARAGDEDGEDGRRRRADELRLRLVRAAASVPQVRRRLRDAWVVMDRVGDAGDNGQRFFEYLREHRRGVNAWFVLRSGSPEFAELRRRHGHRVVDYGSSAWKLLMLHCKHLISSHIDVAVSDPPELHELGLGPGSWKFTFLQHGVIKDDISGWLNGKRIDLFVTSTPAEHASIVGDGTSYGFTDKEVKQLGLPRFDRLRELDRRTPAADRDLVLVAPTWRNWLSDPLKVGHYRRDVRNTFPGSQYARCWLGLLASEQLRDVCRDAGLRLGFLPHPNLQAILATTGLPDHVEALRYSDHDVQELFARSAVMVTDYSSIVFNGAYVDRPVVYFQFDAERVRLGGHLGREGYFDYERDGFGPVTHDIEGTVAAISAAVRHGREPAEPYRSRMHATFPVRDGRCCERVHDAVKALG